MAFKATFQGKEYTDVSEYTKAVSAYETATTAALAAKSATVGKAVKCEVTHTKKLQALGKIAQGKFQIAFGGVAASMFPKAFTRAEMEAMIAHWPTVVSEFRAVQDSVFPTWQSEKRAEGDAKYAAYVDPVIPVTPAVGQ